VNQIERAMGRGIPPFERHERWGTRQGQRRKPATGKPQLRFAWTHLSPGSDTGKKAGLFRGTFFLKSQQGRDVEFTRR
jgi:hypothetical protein